MARVRQKPRRKQSRFPKQVILFGLVLLVGLVLVKERNTIVASVETLFPIRQVRIEGDFANLDPGAVERQLLPLARGNYLTVDLNALEQAAAEVAWVGSVKVTRVWPDTLQVNLTEQNPVARWGDDSLLGESGEVFALPAQSADFSSLPALHSPRGHEREVLGMLSELNQALQSHGSLVSSLKLSDRLAWTVQLSDGLEISIGNQDPLKALERLLGQLPALGDDRLALLKKVDLRYPRGFAVTWKSPVTEDSRASEEPLSRQDRPGQSKKI